MYYRLRDNYILRGWDKLPYALVNTETGQASFLTYQDFKAIEYCNGNIDFSLPFIFIDTNFIHKAELAGIIEQCERGRTLNPNQEYKKYSSPYLQTAHWLITGKCNYKCRHCFVSAHDVNAKELSHEDIMKIINELEDCGIMNVSLTGGEPLIRSDFLEIIDALIERNINIRQIYSNGALVNEKLLTELDKRNIHTEFSMSFDGVGCHDWLRGVPGAERLVDNAFALCRDMGFRTSCEMTLHRGNKHTLRESINHLAGLGVKAIKIAPALEKGEWKKYCGDMALSVRKIFSAYLDYLPYYYVDGLPVKLLLASFFQADPKFPDDYEIIGYNENCNQENESESENEKNFLCSGMRKVTYISPEGRALVCMNLLGTEIEKKYPSIIEKKLSECLRYPSYIDFVNMNLREFIEAGNECKDCKFSKHCNKGCRAAALVLHDKNLMGKSPYLCELYYGGWIPKIIETVKKVRPDVKSPVIINDLN